MNAENKQQIRNNLIIFLSLTNVLLIGLTYCLAYKEVNGHRPQIIKDEYVDENVC